MSSAFLTQLAEAWPVDRWRDVNVLVAVSGGPDSVALLRGLDELKRDAGGAGRLLAAHVNHQLRGADSQRQQAWVETLATNLDLQLFVQQRAAASRAAADGDGIEAAARAERYEALVELAQQTGARYAALGHTRDDQAETVLMRLLRGAGLRGLGGMRRTRALADGVSLIRPLLTVSRAAVTAFLADLGQASFHDASNDDPRFTRNRVRHEVLPVLRTACEGELDALLAELATDAQAAQDIVEAAARAALQPCLLPRPDAGVGIDATPLLAVDAEQLGAHPDYLQLEALRLAWRDADLPEQAMSRRHWEQLGALAGDAAATPVNLPSNLRARRDRQTLIVERLR